VKNGALWNVTGLFQGVIRPLRIKRFIGKGRDPLIDKGIEDIVIVGRLCLRR